MAHRIVITIRARMTDLLTLHEAAELAGVPPEQLKRWAWTGNGPKNSGSKLKPRYAIEDVREWKDKAA